jgi:hypothetical protein
VGRVVLRQRVHLAEHPQGGGEVVGIDHRSRLGGCRPSARIVGAEVLDRRVTRHWSSVSVTGCLLQQASGA